VVLLSLQAEDLVVVEEIDLEWVECSEGDFGKEVNMKNSGVYRAEPNEWKEEQNK